jgi:hypothetical protein
MQDTVSLLATAEVINALAERLDVEGVEMGEPEPADALSDAADAAIGPQEIQDILQFLTIVFAAGGSALLFFQRLVDLLKTLEGSPEVKVVDLTTGKPVATVTPDSDPAEIATSLNK